MQGMQHQKPSKRGRSIDSLQSWIQARASGQWYVATQAPLLWTANSLLSLAIGNTETPHGREFQPVRTIVQLTNEFEGGVRKADAYFPNDLGSIGLLEPEDARVSTALEVNLVKQTFNEDMSCVESNLFIHPRGKNERGFNVTHLLYTTWPDHGVPRDLQSLLQFVRHVEQVHGTDKENRFDEQRPLVVGCSAGIGRTGSFIAISSLLQVAQWFDWQPQLEKSEQPPSPLSNTDLGPFSKDMVVSEIDSLREQRGGMVQKQEQMELVYRILSIT